MNSSATFSGEASTPSECELYIFLGGRLDHSTPQAYAFIVFITVMGFFTCPLTVVLNVLVMIAVMTKPRLKSMSNVVLGCFSDHWYFSGAYRTSSHCDENTNVAGRSFQRSLHGAAIIDTLFQGVCCGIPLSHGPDERRAICSHKTLVRTHNHGH